MKIPAGGALQFEVPSDDPENPDYTKTLEGVILYNHTGNAYWPDGGYDEDESGTPLCSSVDSINGIGNPGGSCEVCPLNAWGSGDSGRGKACKNMRHLYLLRSGDYMPIQVILPPTSIRPFNDFVSTIFAAHRRGTCGSIIQIALKRVDNGNTYRVATFKKLADFTGEQLAQIKLYTGGFKSQVTLLLQQRTDAAESRPESMMEMDATVYGDVYGGSDEGFSISSADDVIDGDRDALPA